MNTKQDYDGIILGTGHNALVLQAYLCRCGLRVASIDRASRYGGGLATVENPRLPGVWQNPHSFYHRAITAMPWFRDLDLAAHGARYVEPELNVAMILRDGRSLQWWTDLDRTVASFEHFSAKDAAALRKWATEFRPILDQILIPEAQSPPLPPEQRKARLMGSKLGRRLLEVSALSPLEFVMREFENEAIRAGLLFFNGLREVDLRLPGFGHAIPALLASPHKAQMCLGGSARLADALVADIRAHGGEIILDAPIERILLSQGRAAGVKLISGDIISAASFVASGLNPQQTFLDLFEDEDLPQPLRDQARGFQYNLLAPLFALHLTLKDPPRYQGVDPALSKAFMIILGLEAVDQFHQIVSAHEAGKIPPPVMWGSCPTVFDPSQATGGRHTAFMWEKVPYALHGNPWQWDSYMAEHSQKRLRHWSSFAPNLEGSVQDLFAMSPLETERSLPNMKGGDLLVGSFGNGQIGYHRPFPGAGQYRTPISGLYLCGSCTHPGGNVTGLCGYNAARIIAADLGLKIWWFPPDLARFCLATPA